jgi:hypothetical protein
MKIKKLNNLLKKYQPIIQTFGISLVLVTISISIWQNNLTQNQLNFALEEKLNEQKPRFEINLNYDKTERLNDWFEIVNKNYNHTLQKVNVQLLNKTDLQKFNIYNKTIRTKKIKNIIIKESQNLFSDYETGLLNIKFQSIKSEIYTFPIIINFEYTENNISKKTSILYGYKFQIYFLGKSRKIKTISLEFIKTLNNKKEKLREVLLNYNLETFEPFNSQVYRNKLKLDLLKKDSIYSPIYKLISLNNEIKREEFEILLKDSTKSKLYFNLPKFILDTILLKKKNQLMSKILNNTKKYNPELLKKIIQIEDSVKMFKNMNQSIDSLEYTNYGIRVFEKHKRTWLELNQELFDMTLDDFKIN